MREKKDGVMEEGWRDRSRDYLDGGDEEVAAGNHLKSQGSERRLSQNGKITFISWKKRSIFPTYLDDSVTVSQ